MNVQDLLVNHMVQRVDEGQNHVGVSGQIASARNNS